MPRRKVGQAAPGDGDDDLEGQPEEVEEEVELKPARPRTPFVVILSYIMNGLLVVGCLGVMTANVLLLLGWQFSDFTSIFELLGRVFNMLLCVLAIVGEFPFEAFSQWFMFLTPWFGRGFLHILIGVLMLSGRSNDDVVALVILISGAWVGGMGALYILLGMCCIKQLKESAHARHRERVEAAELAEEQGQADRVRVIRITPREKK